jgi:hypothetical protein
MATLGDGELQSSWTYFPEKDRVPEHWVGRCTLTPPDSYKPVTERRLVSTLAPIK